jgi:protein involved in polysaccharide export with SLBB domain
VTVQIDPGSTPTFAVFVNASGAVPFDPAANRIFVRFKDAGGVTRGATSVAVKTP